MVQLLGGSQLIGSPRSQPIAPLGFLALSGASLFTAIQPRSTAYRFTVRVQIVSRVQVVSAGTRSQSTQIVHILRNEIWVLLCVL